MLRSKTCHKRKKVPAGDINISDKRNKIGRILTLDNDATREVMKT